MSTATSATTGRPNRSGSSATVLRRRHTIAGWSFILPNFLGFGLLTLIPVIALFYIAFCKWSAFGSPQFTGLANFQRMIHDATFWTALWNTMYYAVIHIPLTLALSLGLALLLNQKLRGLAFFRSAAFFPYFTSIVAVAQVWNMLLAPENGPVNQFLSSLGLSDLPGWTSSSTWAMPAVIIVGTWREMGYYMLLFLAGLQTVPQQLYEAARMDGANAWQRFTNVTLPCLRPTTFFVSIMLTIGSFKVLDLILVMTNGGPGTSTLVLSQYIYRMGFERNDFGYASAISLILFLICLLVTVVQFIHNRRQED
ncbi:sugar ABC transporter permease [Actinomyces sp. MRS3W]|uniref:carbohydrate ABC transporter permease n=1 Tax=Actinomyces sp. MRS3W TaxID=2800796 RepID=UPI0028FD263E|nr:sugar ABC transporter permease [Actinomyces sp. MRS3W]MDU0348917.1 sugar ABC transporter permease [Actinomyces sp. MRS3W]